MILDPNTAVSGRRGASTSTSDDPLTDRQGILTSIQALGGDTLERPDHRDLPVSPFGCRTSNTEQSREGGSTDGSTSVGETAEERETPGAEG